MEKRKVKDLMEGLKSSIERTISDPENFFVFYYRLKFILSDDFPISTENLTPKRGI